MKNEEIKTWSGVWWIYSKEANQEKNRAYGTLSISDEGEMILQLESTPQENLLKCKLRDSYTIWGIDKYHVKITLFNVYLKTYTSSNGIKTLLVNHTLIGEHVSSLDTPIFNRVTAKYTNLKEFFFVPQVQMSYKNEFVLFQVGSSKKDKLNIPIEEGTNWVLEGNYYWEAKTRCQEVRIQQDTDFSIECQSEKSITEFYKQIGEFSDFLSLALQGKQRPRKICFSSSSEKLQTLDFYYSIEKSEKCRCHLIGNSVPIERLSVILRNWHENYAQISPIYSYLERSSFDNNATLGIPEFLLIEFALEGYFKRFHNKTRTDGKNLQKLKDQIRTLLDYYTNIDIIAHLDLDIDTIVDTRNAYTHLFPDNEKSGYEIQDVHQLWINTEKLRILLLCCILDSMGFTHKEIDINFKTAPILNPEAYQNNIVF